MISLLEKAKYFIQGNINYFLYYTNFPLISFGLQNHIREQIEYRFSSLKKECIEYNACQELQCGCDLSKQVMSNKLCLTGPCQYRPFMNKKDWNKFKENNNTLKIKSDICIGKTLL